MTVSPINGPKRPSGKTYSGTEQTAATPLLTYCYDGQMDQTNTCVNPTSCGGGVSGERKMVMSRVLEPQLSFADLELRLPGLQLDPTVLGIVDFLDDHPALVEHVRRDLERGLKNPAVGRNGISPEQTLRFLLPTRVKNSRTARAYQRWLYLAWFCTRIIKSATYPE